MYLMFDRQFADKIKDGTKRSTIRRTPKREFRVGQTLDLRAWKSSPYRSKMETLAQVEIKEVIPIRFEETTFDVQIKMETTLLSWDETRQLASQEGFDSVAAMTYYINESYGLPFDGILIEW